jgi:hypothetical protein
MHCVDETKRPLFNTLRELEKERSEKKLALAAKEMEKRLALEKERLNSKLMLARERMVWFAWNFSLIGCIKGFSTAARLIGST